MLHSEDEAMHHSSSLRIHLKSLTSTQIPALSYKAQVCHPWRSLVSMLTVMLFFPSTKSVFNLTVAVRCFSPQPGQTSCVYTS